MDRFLALDQRGRTLAFEQAGVARGLSASSVEKDFWVCFMLRELFAMPELGQHLTFKGGTSLSKAWGLIDRFSEDIDLTIEREYLGFVRDSGPESATSGKERSRRLDRLKAACRDHVAERIHP
ncbi:MAG TPA: nucleotidyl transferase AbiEii/AbiGii toxin family protein, partial [Gemmatimonadales bacterium]